MNDMKLYEDFIHLSRYAKWLPSEGRKETWLENTKRYIQFMRNHIEHNINIKLENNIWEMCEHYISKKLVMPSMRSFMTAGPSLERDHVAGYNCSYLPINDIKSFSEILYILMCGTGVGFSVENSYVNCLPKVPEKFKTIYQSKVIDDDKISWCENFNYLITSLYNGYIPVFDMSQIRAEGLPLKTFGGRSAGPDVLAKLFDFVITKFKQAAGRKLTSLECHDIVCFIATVAVVGANRRAALISLSDLNDKDLRSAKSGEWYLPNNFPYRCFANNSAVYNNKPDDFFDEWISLYHSKSGERGIFNRQFIKQKFKNQEIRNPDIDYGTNPCGEIILRPKQFCNLTEVIIRPNDDISNMTSKIYVATILGTIQSTLDNFRFLSSDWHNNAVDERLLGVSLTGIYDNSYTNGTYTFSDGSPNLCEILNNLKKYSRKINELYSKKLGIKTSAAITCIKPSGNVSQLNGCSSGIHPRFSQYYIRRVRASKNDPVSKLMIASNIPVEDDKTDPKSFVFSFPIRSPESAKFRKDLSALEHLELWKVYSENYCEHNPSVTINIRENEWLGVGNWVYNNFNKIGGISFLPYSDHIYSQAPYEEIDEQTYNKMANEMPNSIDWDKLIEYEGGQENNIEFACTGGMCEF